MHSQVQCRCKISRECMQMRGVRTSEISEGYMKLVGYGSEGKHGVGMGAAIRKECGGRRVGVKERVEFSGFIALQGWCMEKVVAFDVDCAVAKINAGQGGWSGGGRVRGEGEGGERE